MEHNNLISFHVVIPRRQWADQTSSLGQAKVASGRASPALLWLKLSWASIDPTWAAVIDKWIETSKGLQKDLESARDSERSRRSGHGHWQIMALSTANFAYVNMND